MSGKDRQKIHLAQQVANLLEDETYRRVINGVRQRQADVMLMPSSTEAELLQAHGIVRALDEIDRHIRTVYNAGAVEDRKED